LVYMIFRVIEPDWSVRFVKPGICGICIKSTMLATWSCI
jgi:hypothetical protein